MAIQSEATYMDVEGYRMFYNIPDHIPDEQIDRYIGILQEKDIERFRDAITFREGKCYQI